MLGLIALVIVAGLFTWGVAVGFQTAMYMLQDGSMPVRDVLGLIRERPIQKRSRFYAIMCRLIR